MFNPPAQNRGGIKDTPTRHGMHTHSTAHTRAHTQPDHSELSVKATAAAVLWSGNRRRTYRTRLTRFFRELIHLLFRAGISCFHYSVNVHDVFPRHCRQYRVALFPITDSRRCRQYYSTYVLLVYGQYCGGRYCKASQ